MGKRRSSQVKISLFSFQDIITSVTGIMILTTLLLALELINRTQGSPPVQTAEHTKTSQQTSGELRTEIENLRQQLSAADQDVRDYPSLNAAELDRMVQSTAQSTKRLQSELNTLQTKLSNKLNESKQVEDQTKQDKQEGEQQLKKLEQQIADAEQTIAEVEGSNRVYYSSGVQGKRMWVVEITASGLVVAEMGVQSVPKNFSSVDAFKQWLDTLELNDHALFLLIKPGGAVTFRQVQKHISGNMDYGYQVVAADQQVLDPKIGAGKP